MAIGQRMYTPANSDRDVADPRDRPYAGWSYVMTDVRTRPDPQTPTTARRSHRAEVLMMYQPLVTLLIISVLIARAINTMQSSRGMPLAMANGKAAR